MYEFDYQRPATVDEAVKIGGGDARFLAGGQSLVQSMKLRLASAPTLVDLGAIPDLRFIKVDGNTVAIGAMIRNPAQAALLQRIAARGADSFYVGPEAQKIVTTVNTAARNPSKMTTGDLASYLFYLGYSHRF